MISKLAISHDHLPMKMAKVIKTLVTNSVNSILLKTKCFLWISEATRRLVIWLTNEYVSRLKKGFYFSIKSNASNKDQAFNLTFYCHSKYVVCYGLYKCSAQGMIFPRHTLKAQIIAYSRLHSDFINSFKVNSTHPR